MISRAVCSACRKKWSEGDSYYNEGIPYDQTEWECPRIASTLWLREHASDLGVDIPGETCIIDLGNSENSKGQEPFVPDQCPNRKKHAKAKDTKWAGPLTAEDVAKLKRRYGPRG